MDSRTVFLASTANDYFPPLGFSGPRLQSTASLTGASCCYSVVNSNLLALTSPLTCLSQRTVAPYAARAVVNWINEGLSKHCSNVSVVTRTSV